MAGVNKQLALFFKQVGMNSYLKYSINFLVAAYFIFVIDWKIIIILMHFIEIDEIYKYVSGWLYLIIFFSVYLFVTLVFYYLADFNFVARVNQVKPETNHKIASPTVNISASIDSADTTLIQKNIAYPLPDTFQLPASEAPGIEKIYEQVTTIIKSKENYNWAW